MASRLCILVEDSFHVVQSVHLPLLLLHYLVPAVVQAPTSLYARAGNQLENATLRAKALLALIAPHLVSSNSLASTGLISVFSNVNAEHVGDAMS